ncbi:hypothetical protein [Dyadobacter tibetensis]|uniref:hypothetical protein n=1 Tax=Dyadobacter tibetensis TaxID=1211851 RepID=UPI000471F3E4|nr:hypothetical protein [Dyadobacter tibetensis]
METLIIKAEGKKLKSLISVLDALDIEFRKEKDTRNDLVELAKKYHEMYRKRYDKMTGFDQFEGL